MKNNCEDIKQEVAKIMIARGYDSVGYELGRKLHMEALRNLRMYSPKKNEKIKPKIIEKIGNKTVYEYIPPGIEPEKIQFLSLDKMKEETGFDPAAPEAEEEEELGDVWVQPQVSFTKTGRIKKQKSVEDLPLFIIQ